MTAGVAVIDIGKTNAKLALVSLDTLTEVAIVTRPNAPLPGPPYPHFDTEGHWAFLLDALKRFQADHGISAISITTHGASGALIAADGTLAAPILDYEHTGPQETAAAYDALRPPFAQTGAPRLADGLNLGAQIHWQLTRDPSLASRTASVVTYPQYWAHRLTGILASDVTSLGCHTDLWNPHTGAPSGLLAALGLSGKLAPPRPCADVLGPILPAIAAATGLPPDTPVHCGIHDSNASLLPHLLTRAKPFSVVSTGTWVIAMSIGGTPTTLDPSQDTLINVAATGGPVPSARFMGGREHDIASQGPYPEPTDADMAAILADQTMLLPALVPQTGPFQGHSAAWIGREPAPGTGTRGAAISFYLAMVTAQSLRLIGRAGPIVVEGPFAQNRPYCLMLQAVTGAPIVPMGGTTGTAQGSALLARGAKPAAAEPLHHSALPAHLSGPAKAYHAAWKAALRPSA